MHSTSDLFGYSTLNDRPFNQKVRDRIPLHFAASFEQVRPSIAGLCILGFGCRSRVGYDFPVVWVGGLGACCVFYCDNFHLDHGVDVDTVVVVGVGLRNGREKLRIFRGFCLWLLSLYVVCCLCYPWCL